MFFFVLLFLHRELAAAALCSYALVWMERRLLLLLLLLLLVLDKGAGSLTPASTMLYHTFTPCMHHSLAYYPTTADVVLPLHRSRA